MSISQLRIWWVWALACTPFVGTAASDTRATIDLLYDYYKSAGGRAQLETLSSLKVSGKVDARMNLPDGKAQSVRQDFELWLAKPFLVRFNIRTPDSELIRGWDGYYSWIVMPDGNGGRRAIEAPVETHQGLLYLAVLFDNLYALERRGFSLNAAADETFEGVVYSVLRFRYEKQSLEGEFLFDKKTARPAVVRVYPFFNEKRHDGVARLSDWRQVDGIYYPFSVAYTEDGIAQFTLSVERVRPNVAAPSLYFVMPDKDVQWIQAERERKKAESAKALN